MAKGPCHASRPSIEWPDMNRLSPMTATLFKPVRDNLTRTGDRDKIH